jgi:hypothetical protein
LKCLYRYILDIYTKRHHKVLKVQILSSFIYLGQQLVLLVRLVLLDRLVLLGHLEFL